MSRLLPPVCVATLSCVAVFTFVRAEAQESAATEPPPVRFAAYNLRNYLRMERRIGDAVQPNAAKPEREISALLEILSALEPDALGVSEIGDQTDLDDLQQRLAAAGRPLPHTTLVLAADPARHLALLSRYPIVQTRHQTGLTYHAPDRLLPMQRGILDATIEPQPGYLLRIVGVHLKSRRPAPEADQAFMRRREAHLLRRHLVGILDDDPGANVLVFGDCNDTPNEPGIRDIQGRFGTGSYFAALTLADRAGLRWTYYWNEADQYSRFDYLFVSPGLAPEIIQEASFVADHPRWLEASDHRPVVTAVTPRDR